MSRWTAGITWKSSRCLVLHPEIGHIRRSPLDAITLSTAASSSSPSLSPCRTASGREPCPNTSQSDIFQLLFSRPGVPTPCKVPPSPSSLVSLLVALQSFCCQAIGRFKIHVLPVSLCVTMNSWLGDCGTPRQQSSSSTSTQYSAIVEPWRSDSTSRHLRSFTKLWRHRSQRLRLTTHGR